MKQKILYTIIAVLIGLSITTNSMAQDKRIHRIAQIHVDPTQLDKYKGALRAQMTTAIAVEAGVLSYYAVSDKKDPSHISIFEIYADSAAYNAHIQTLHFKKYKEAVKNMIKSLELEDVDVVAFSKKPGL